MRGSIGACSVELVPQHDSADLKVDTDRAAVTLPNATARDSWMSPGVYDCVNMGNHSGAAPLVICTRVRWSLR